MLNALFQTDISIRDSSNPCAKTEKHAGLFGLTTKAATLITILGLVSSCSTRQLSDSVTGSTAQRLATYSLEKFVRNLMEQSELRTLADQKIALRVHFLKDHALLDYATQLLRYQLESKYQVQFVEINEPAQYEVDVFFNSIGTDHDNFGLSIPGFGLAATPGTRISCLLYTSPSPRDLSTSRMPSSA